MSKELVESIKRYRTIYANFDWRYCNHEHAEDVMAEGWELIQLLAREVVVRAERRGELPQVPS